MLKGRESGLSKVAVAGLLGEAAMNVNNIPVAVRVGTLILSCGLGNYGALEFFMGSDDTAETGHVEPSQPSLQNLIVAVEPSS